MKWIKVKDDLPSSITYRPGEAAIFVAYGILPEGFKIPTEKVKYKFNMIKRSKKK